MRTLLVLILLLPFSFTTANVTVQPGKTLLKKNITIPARRIVAYRLNLKKGNTLFARYIVKGGLNRSFTVWFTDAGNYQLQQSRLPYRVYPGASRLVKEIGRASCRERV